MYFFFSATVLKKKSPYSNINFRKFTNLPENINVNLSYDAI